MADWIALPIGERCPNAEIYVDPFHVTGLSTDALDEVRREVWNDTRKAGQPGLSCSGTFHSGPPWIATPSM